MTRVTAEQIRKSIRRMVEDMVPVQTKLVKVVSVDKDANTITVDDDGIEVEDVLLSLDGDQGLIKYPVEGCKALIGLIGNHESQAFMIDCHEVEEIKIRVREGFEWLLNKDVLTINGDNFGGFGRTDRIAERLTRVEEAVEKLRDDFNGHTHTTGCTAGGAAVPAPDSGSGVALNPKTDQAYISNDKIKHG